MLDSDARKQHPNLKIVALNDAQAENNPEYSANAGPKDANVPPETPVTEQEASVPPVVTVTREYVQRTLETLPAGQALEFPVSVKEFEARCFAGTSVAKVRIPRNTEKLGGQLFSGCK